MRSIGDSADWTERVEALCACPLTVFSLQIAGCDVVDRDDSANCPLCFAFARPLDGRSNHNSDLSLEFHALGLLGKNYRFAGGDDARRRLQKKQRLGWNLVTHLFRVL